MSYFNDLLDQVLTGIDVGPSLGMDAELADALRRIGARQEEDLDFEPSTECWDEVAAWQARNPDLPF
jgi:hypothetical protein